MLKHAYGDSMRAKRDYAMLAMLFGCGFRRSELVGLELDEIQVRQGGSCWGTHRSRLRSDISAANKIWDIR